MLGIFSKANDHKAAIERFLGDVSKVLSIKNKSTTIFVESTIQQAIPFLSIFSIIGMLFCFFLSLLKLALWCQNVSGTICVEKR